MEIILKKTDDGWDCLLCKERLRGWKDSELHGFTVHGIQRDHIHTRTDNGDIIFVSTETSLDVLRDAGVI